MKEYIERAAAIEAIRKYQYPYGVEFLLANIPAAEVVEVRHGRWEKHPQSNEDDPVYTCSLCKLNVSGFEKRWIKYCPNCGVRMDKEDEHEAD